MSETDNKPTLGRKPLGLKRSVEAGEVKQTFSHGRTNKVVVEVKRRKLIGKPGEAQAPAPEPVAAPPPPPQPVAPPPRRGRSLKLQPRLGPRRARIRRPSPPRAAPWRRRRAASLRSPRPSAPSRRALAAAATSIASAAS